MEAKVLSEAKVYVGTYAKYNNGSLSGAWLDLSDYSDKEEFYEACRELHKDEEDGFLNPSLPCVMRWRI